MDSKAAVVLDTLLRTQRFLDANDAALGQVNRSGARKTLDQVVTDLTTHGNVQESSKRKAMGETSKQRALRVAVLKQMRSVARIAASTLRDIPQFSSLTMPPSKASAREVTMRAHAMADAALPHASVFTDAGLSADFTDRLLAAAGAVEASLGDRNESGATRVTATQGTLSASRRGRHAVKVLDALVRLQLADDNDLLAGWVSAKRFHLIRTAAAVAPSPSGAVSAAPPASGAPVQAPGTSSAAA
jgi:hypothetical protein